MNLGMELREERIRQNRTMTEIAKALGVSEAYISLVETGKRNPSPEILGKWLGQLSTDEDFKRRAITESAGRDMERAADTNIHAMAGYAMRFLSRAEQSGSEADRDQVRKLLQSASRRGMAPTDFALVVKKMLADAPFRELIVALARMSEKDRQRFVEAFSKLLPEGDIPDD